MNKTFQTIIAGHVLRYSLLFHATRFYFHPYLFFADGDSYDIAVSRDLLDSAKNKVSNCSSEAYLEFLLLIELTAKVLLEYNTCIFHAVSLFYRGNAFLLSAPPGVGKTTQYLNWQRLFPGEIEMICGDKPALEAREDGSVWVWPSPWNGKERIRGTKAAPLAGIVLLEQGQENSIVPLSPSEALIPLFEQFLVVPETEAQIKSLARLSDQMLRSAKLYKLTNLGNDASTRLLRNTLLAAAEEENGNADV